MFFRFRLGFLLFKFFFIFLFLSFFSLFIQFILFIIYFQVAITPCLVYTIVILWTFFIIIIISYFLSVIEQYVQIGSFLFTVIKSTLRRTKNKLAA